MKWHTHREKTQHNDNDKKGKDTENRTKERVKVNRSSIYSRELTNRTTERVQTRSRWSTETNRERLEKTINERGKKITGIS